MSVIGLDFGSHAASIAIWYEDKDAIEVLADDLGSRTIPCTIAFRGDEIITGQSAVSQQHKNAANTFEDIRSLLMNLDNTHVNVPLLEKELHVQELASHFFRNIHNQIKQQVGKAVRDCVISTPTELDENTKKRFTESAQAGGIRIKSFLSDSAATLMAYELDNATHVPSKTLVVDIGWSRTDVALYDVSAGLFTLLGSASNTDVCGKLFVKLAADHCAKEFQRKTKVPCTEYSKSMMRLRLECENALKSLSTGNEATIDIDSLCEGMDYSSKISRARLEDLLSVPFVHLKTCIASVLAAAGVDSSEITKVCMSGGPSSMPKVGAIVRGLFPGAAFPKVKFESNETQCIGAANHGKSLLQQGLVDSAPTASPDVVCLHRGILLASSGAPPVTVLPARSNLPIRTEIAASVPQGTGHLQVLVTGVDGAADPLTLVGEVVFALESAAEQAGGDDLPAADLSAVVVSVSVSATGEISVQVSQTASKKIIGGVVIPSADI